MNIFERNLNVLTGKYPTLEETIIHTYTPAEDVVIEQTASGEYTARWNGKYLHSKRNPAGEAKRLVAAEITRSPAACIIVGFGLGYLAEAFVSVYPDVPCIIMEPNVPLFLRALEARDLSALFESDSLSLLLDTAPEAVFPLLEHAAREAANSEIKTLYVRSLYEENADYIQTVDRALRTFFARKEINTNTLKRFGKLWIRNLIRNLHLIAESRGTAELTGAFAGTPALLLAAGPSLDALLPHIKELQKRCVVIAVDTAVNFCIKAGINPDFLVVVDPQYWNTRHLDYGPSLDTVLISESSTHPRVFRLLGDKTLYFCSSLFPLGTYLEERVEQKGKLGAGGSVATSAWDFARVAGCSAIYCGGMDLGFPDGITHYRGSFFETSSHASSARLSPAETFGFSYLYNGRPFPAVNNSGTATLTDKRLIIYKWWFENQMKQHSEPLTFSLSPHGVEIEGMDYLPAADLLELPEKRDEIESVIAPLRNPETMSKDSAEAKHSKLVAAVDELNRELMGLEEVVASGLGIAEEITEKIDGNENISPLLPKLDDVDRTIMSRSTKDIAGFLLKHVTDTIINTEPDPRDPKSVIAQSITLYSELLASIQHHRHLILSHFER